MNECNCPTCSTTHTIKLDLVHWVVCSNCQHLLEHIGGQLISHGETPSVPGHVESRFALGDTGQVRGRWFEIIGRIHFRYNEHEDPHYWDAWYIQFEDSTSGSILDEDGEAFLYIPRATVTEELPDYASLQVGSKIRIEGYDAEVFSIGEDVVIATEGQTIEYFKPKRKGQYVDCSFRNYVVNVEYSDGQKLVYFGTKLKPNEIRLDKE